MDELKKASATMRISAILSSGLEGEAMTNKDYFRDLSDIVALAQEAGLTEEQVDVIVTNYEEIIADELNHQKKFYDMVTLISEIVPNQD